MEISISMNGSWRNIGDDVNIDISLDFINVKRKLME
jgi:hypothetical protein